MNFLFFKDTFDTLKYDFLKKLFCFEKYKLYNFTHLAVLYFSLIICFLYLLYITLMKYLTEGFGCK